MVIKLTIDQIKQFPIHDAELHSFTVTRDINGNIVVTIDIKVTDDSYDPGYPYSIQNGIIHILLLNCFVVITDFKGFWAGQDTFDDLKMIDNSELLERICKIKASELQHFRFTLHSGSQIDIIAESIEVRKTMEENGVSP